MMVLKKLKFRILLIIFSFGIGCIATLAFSQEKTVNASLDKVFLTSQDGFFNFYDQANGKVYVYSQTNGKLVATYTIEELGQDLKKTEERRAVVY